MQTDLVGLHMILTPKSGCYWEITFYSIYQIISMMTEIQAIEGGQKDVSSLEGTT